MPAILHGKKYFTLWSIYKLLQFNDSITIQGLQKIPSHLFLLSQTQIWFSHHFLYSSLLLVLGFSHSWITYTSASYSDKSIYFLRNAQLQFQDSIFIFNISFTILLPTPNTPLFRVSHRASPQDLHTSLQYFWSLVREVVLASSIYSRMLYAPQQPDPASDGTHR